MDNKISIKLEESISNLTFSGSVISVKEYISMSNKSLLIDGYIEDLYKDENVSKNYIVAEIGLILGIIECVTNFEINPEEYNLIVTSGLWQSIKSLINNVDEIYDDIAIVIKEIERGRMYENSAKIVVQQLLAGISNLSIDENKLKEYKEEFTKVSDKISDIFPTIKEEKKVEKPTKKRRASRVE